MAKRSKEWSDKISKAITQKWKEKEYRQKQTDTLRSEEYRTKKSEEMKKKWDNDQFKERMTGESHPNWNPNREEVQKPYGPGWYGKKEEHVKSLREEQNNRDALTGDKFKVNDIIVRHHIDHDKSNNVIKNLCGLTPETHAKVHNESDMTRDEYIKAFQDGKENLKNGIPPGHWSDKNKEDYKKEKNQEHNPISEKNAENTKRDQKNPDSTEPKTKEKSGDKDIESSNERHEESKEKNGEKQTKADKDHTKESKQPEEPNERSQNEPQKENDEKKETPSENEPSESSESMNDEQDSKETIEGSGVNQFEESIEDLKDDGNYRTNISDYNDIPIIEDYSIRDDLEQHRFGGDSSEKDYAGIDDQSGEGCEDYKGINEEYGGAEYGGEA